MSSGDAKQTQLPQGFRQRKPGGREAPAAPGASGGSSREGKQPAEGAALAQPRRQQEPRQQDPQRQQQQAQGAERQRSAALPRQPPQRRLSGGKRGREEKSPPPSQDTWADAEEARRVSLRQPHSLAQLPLPQQQLEGPPAPEAAAAEPAGLPELPSPRGTLEHRDSWRERAAPFSFLRDCRPTELLPSPKAPAAPAVPEAARQPSGQDGAERLRSSAPRKRAPQRVGDPRQWRPRGASPDQQERFSQPQRPRRAEEGPASPLASHQQQQQQQEAQRQPWLTTPAPLAAHAPAPAPVLRPPLQQLGSGWAAAAAAPAAAPDSTAVPAVAGTAAAAAAAPAAAAGPQDELRVLGSASLAEIAGTLLTILRGEDQAKYQEVQRFVRQASFPPAVGDRRDAARAFYNQLKALAGEESMRKVEEQRHRVHSRERVRTWVLAHPGAPIPQFLPGAYGSGRQGTRAQSLGSPGSPVYSIAWTASRASSLARSGGLPSRLGSPALSDATDASLMSAGRARPPQMPTPRHAVKMWDAGEKALLLQLAGSEERRQEVLGAPELDWASVGEHFGVSAGAARATHYELQHEGSKQRATRAELDLVEELAVQALLRIRGEQGFARNIVQCVEQNRDLWRRLQAVPELLYIQDGKAKMTRFQHMLYSRPKDEKGPLKFGQRSGKKDFMYCLRPGHPLVEEIRAQEEERQRERRQQRRLAGSEEQQEAQRPQQQEAQREQREQEAQRPQRAQERQGHQAQQAQQAQQGLERQGQQAPRPAPPQQPPLPQQQCQRRQGSPAGQQRED